MRCNCMLTNIILGIIILLSVVLLSNPISGWIIAIAAIAIIVHAIIHKKTDRYMKVMPEEKKTAKRKR